MAQAGHRTLLIDADMRKPVQHKMFDVRTAPGLAEVVMRGARFDQAVQRTDIEGLSLLPAGQAVANPSEITSSQAFGQLLQRLEAQYDLVIIDSPPLLVVADARILGAQAGMTVIVARADKTTRQELKQACQRLVSVGSSLLGVVLNDVPQRARHNGYEAEEVQIRVPSRAEFQSAPLVEGRLH